MQLSLYEKRDVGRVEVTVWLGVLVRGNVRVLCRHGVVDVLPLWLSQEQRSPPDSNEVTLLLRAVSLV